MYRRCVLEPLLDRIPWHDDVAAWSATSRTMRNACLNVRSGYWKYRLLRARGYDRKGETDLAAFRLYIARWSTWRVNRSPMSTDYGSSAAIVADGSIVTWGHDACDDVSELHVPADRWGYVCKFSRQLCTSYVCAIRCDDGYLRTFCYKSSLRSYVERESEIEPQHLQVVRHVALLFKSPSCPEAQRYVQKVHHEPDGIIHALNWRGDIVRCMFGDGWKPSGRTPELSPGERYVQFGRCNRRVVALRNDGQLVPGEGCYTLHLQVPPHGVLYTMVSVGYSHVLALRSDGTAVGFGEDHNRCISDLPPPPPLGLRYVHVCAGLFYSMVLRSDGRLFTCGYAERTRNAPRWLRPWID